MQPVEELEDAAEQTAYVVTSRRAEASIEDCARERQIVRYTGRKSRERISQRLQLGARLLLSILHHLKQIREAVLNKADFGTRAAAFDF